jgi:hypothetical protein
MFLPTLPSSGVMKFRGTAVPFAHCTRDRQQAYQKDNTCGIEGGTTLSSFKNITSTKTSIALVRKAQQFLQISAHLMMAE